MIGKRTDSPHRVARRQERECARIDDPQTFHANHPRGSVDDGIPIGTTAHGAGGGGVVDSGHGFADQVQDLGVCGDLTNASVS